MQAVPPVRLDDDDDYYDYNRMDDDTTQRQIFANFAKLKRRESPSGSDDERERVKLAHETARLIQLEVQRWEASVAELEASVMQQQQQQLPGNRNNVVFPTMPAVVVDVMDDHCHPRIRAAPPLAVTLPPPPAPLAVADWNESEEEDVEMDEDDQTSADSSIS